MLTDDQIAAFHRDGVLVVNDVVEPVILDAVRDEYCGLLDALYAGWQQDGLVPEASGFNDKLIAAYRAGCDWFQPLDISLPGDRITADTPMHFGPAVFDMIRSKRILNVVETLIGPEITSNPIQHVRIKPPEQMLDADEVRAHVGGTDWHQDRAVAHAEADATDMVTVWIAVTDATVENGCLQAQPFRGPQTMLPHCPQRQTAIAKGYIDEATAQPLPVRAGGIVLFHPLVPHASLPNRSDGLRWSFDLRYNRTGQPTGRAHFPEFIARSHADPETELHDWRAWRSLWEAARTQLATTPHIDIHRWRSDAPVCA
jgi:phytanoyl-CoA hydroxylase